MSKNKRDLTPEERTLWRRVATTVKARRALPPQEEAHPAKTPARKLLVGEPAPLVRKEPRPAPSPPHNRASEKRVRRGDVEIGATLDLHGHTQDSARTALFRFLLRAQRRGDRTVIVVTGVGRGGEGVLKRRFPGWLAEKDARPLIAGYAPAHRSHGGAGAFYVFLKRAHA